MNTVTRNSKPHDQYRFHQTRALLAGTIVLVALLTATAVDAQMNVKNSVGTTLVQIT